MNRWKDAVERALMRAATLTILAALTLYLIERFS